MGIFDFFKKKKKEFGPQIIGFEDVKEALSKKRQEIEEKQIEPKRQIEESLSELINGLEESIIVLKNISLKDKKAMEREKLIVRQNLNNFIYYLEKLISDLKKLNPGYFENLINDINAIFSEFEKKSIISFQKSTYLIGEELGGVRDNISKFFRVFNNIIKETRFLTEQMKTISDIKAKLIDIESSEKIESENRETITDIENKIKSLYCKINEKREEITEIKKSRGYIEQMNANQELEKARAKLSNEMQKLREMIDFKLLAKIYHSSQRQMFIINDFKNNFKDSFERYGPEKILELTEAKEINQEQIQEKLNAIDKIMQDIDNTRIGEDITKALEKDIDYIKSKIAELISEKLKKEKLSRKFQEGKEQIKKQIANELKGLSLILE